MIPPLWRDRNIAPQNSIYVAQYDDYATLSGTQDLFIPPGTEIK